jgi:hypothetical protein
MKEFKEMGIFNQAGLNVFDAIIGNDYTKSDIEDILASTEFIISEIENILNTGGGRNQKDLEKFQTVLKNKDEIIEKIKAKL